MVKRNDNGKVCRIHSLPDDLFPFIFKYLSMKEALTVCISCKRMNHLKSWIPNLEFQASPLKSRRQELAKVILNFLKDKRCDINNFKIRSPTNFFDSQYDDEWIKTLSQLHVEEVCLVFDGRFPGKLPAALFCFSKVTSLRLKFCEFSVPDEFEGITCLKKLQLVSVRLDESHSQLVCFVTKCKNLWLLSLKRCRIQNIDFSNTTTSVEVLSIEDCTPCTVNVPSVRSLEYTDQNLQQLSIDESNEFAHVMISRETETDLDEHEAYDLRDNILQHLTHVESLSIDGWAFKCLAQGDAIRMLETNYINLVKLEVEICIPSYNELLCLSCLLERAKHLQNLRVLMRQEPHFGEDDRSVWTHKLEAQFGRNHFNELHTIEINKLKGTAFDFRFVEFVLNNAMHLQRMSITLVDEGMFTVKRNRKLHHFIQTRPGLIITVNNNIVS